MGNGLFLFNMLMTSLAYGVNAVSPGTNPHLKEIFLGRCWDYQLIKYKKLASEKAVPCDDLWNSFFQAFSHKAPCSLVMSYYQEYTDKAKQDLPENKVMFWSGTYVIAHEYAQEGARYITLEDTLIGYLANSLVWCGSGSDSSGMNLTQCPSWRECPSESSEAFWAAASIAFSKSAKGEVYLVLDGSRDDRPAYKQNSFFSKYELPNLTQATKIVILVMHAISGQIRETCKNGTIVDLKKDIKKYKIPFKCIDDPPAIVHLLCADDTSARECRLAEHQLLLHGKKKAERRSLLVNDRPDRFS